MFIEEPEVRSDLKVIAGLGNPGVEYENTRHNAGFWFVDYLAYKLDFPDFVREGSTYMVSRGELGSHPLLIVKPMLYMNRSGIALSELWKRDPFDPANLLVCYDDTALECGKIRLRPKGSAGGHNGIKSVIEALGSDHCPRLRIGVGGASLPEPGESLADYVLSEFDNQKEEDAVLDTFPLAQDAVKCWLDDGMEIAMNRYN